MKRSLTIITLTLALGALTACSPALTEIPVIHQQDYRPDSQDDPATATTTVEPTPTTMPPTTICSSQDPSQDRC